MTSPYSSVLVQKDPYTLSPVGHMRHMSRPVSPPPSSPLSSLLHPNGAEKSKTSP
jgi:hypothetical protein